LRAAKAAASKRYLQPLPAKLTLQARRAARATGEPRVNVVGVGIGRKRVGGKLTDTMCVRIYVRRKLDKRALDTRTLLPKRIRGMPTDVIETGSLEAFDAITDRARSRLRPVQPGCSVGFRFAPPNERFRMAGTLGAIVARGGERYLLSNNHVLADEGRLAPGAPIFQPGLLDGGRVASDRVATLTRFVPFRRTNNSVDAAIARADRAALVTTRFVAGVTLRSARPLAATLGLAVHKVGRTTGYTRGTVEDISADVRVGYDGGEYLFVDQIVIRGASGAQFSDSGDSGSLIVGRSSGRATGLLFAGSDTDTIANSIELVLAAFGVELVV
jgi:hypothetical protein